MTCARSRRGETVMPVSAMILLLFHEKSVEKSTPWTISQKSHEHAIVIIDV